MLPWGVLQPRTGQQRRHQIPSAYLWCATNAWSPACWHPQGERAEASSRHLVESDGSLLQRGKSLIKDLQSAQGEAHQRCQKPRVIAGSRRCVPSSPKASRGVFMSLCRRCDICIAAKERRRRSGWAPLLAFCSFSFSSSFWQVVLAGAVSAAQDGVGLLRCGSSSARVGLTALASVQRGASGGAGHRPAGFTGGGSLLRAKYAATGGRTRQRGTRTRRGCGAGREQLEVLQKMVGG